MDSHVSNSRHIVELKRLENDQDARIRLRTQMRGDQELSDVISQYSGTSTPETDTSTDPPHLCLGNDYAPQFRTITDTTGRTVPNPDYDADTDICGRTCAYGLHKMNPEDTEVQGSQGCYLLLLSSRLMNLPLPPPELGVETANGLRVELIEILPGALDRAERSAQMLDSVPQPTTTMAGYVLQQEDIVHEGFVYDGETRQVRQHSDGTYIRETDVVAAPVTPAGAVTPPALPSGTVAPAVPPTIAPPAGIPASSPGPPTPVETPGPTTPSIPSVPTPRAPSAGLPPTPEKPPMSAKPATVTTEIPPIQETPSIDEPETSTEDVAEMIDEVQNSIVSHVVDTMDALRVTLGISQDDDTDETRVETQPQSPASEGISILKLFHDAMDNDFSGVARAGFRHMFVQGADSDELQSMHATLGMEWTYGDEDTAKNRKSAGSALVLAVYGRTGNTPKTKVELSQ